MEQKFIDWIYANCRICNGDMLVLAESEEDALYKASRLPDQVRCDYFERVFRPVSSRVVESNA